MRSRLALLFVALCISPLFFSLINSDSFIDELIDRVSAKRKIASKERVFIHTDRNSYNHGDTLWLKGYVTNYSTSQPSLISQTIYVDILNENNDKVLSQEFFNDQGTFEGVFIIPIEFDDGEYRLVAYTSAMRNYSAEWFFTKSLYFKNIRSTSQITPNLDLKISFDQQEYKTGDDVVARLSFIRKEDDAFNKTRLKYEIRSGKALIKSFDGEAINAGDINIRFQIPIDAKSVSIVSEIKNRDVFLSQTSLVPIRPNDIMVAFFPEGGDIIRGITNNIGFMATDSLGNHLDITGELVDDRGNKVFSVSSEHNGLGKFSLVPANGRSYALKVYDRLYSLPKIKKKGYVMSVEKKSKDTLNLRLNTHYPSSKKVKVTATLRDNVYWAIDGYIDKTALVKIPMKEIPHGILQVTLFDEHDEPINELLSYVNSHKKLNVVITKNEEVFGKRDSTGLKIKVTDHLGRPVQGDFSLAAKDQLFDTNKQNSYSGDIGNYLSFASHLRGTWQHQLAQLPTWNEEKTLRVIDLMLMTYGWRTFEWGEGTDQDSLINYEQIKGRVTKGRKNALTNTPVFLLSPNGNGLVSSLTDSTGLFAFDKRQINNSTYSILTTSIENVGLSSVNVAMLPDEVTYHLNKRPDKTDGITYKSDLDARNRKFEVRDFAYYRLLQDVVIKENLIDVKKDPNMRGFRGANVSSKTGDELSPSIDIVGLIRQVTYVKRNDQATSSIFLTTVGLKDVPALFVVDGFRIGQSYTSIANISAANIEYLSVVRGVSGTSIYGSEGRGGVIFITTRYAPNNDDPDTPKNTAFVKGYAKKRVFYAPKYATQEAKDDPVPDVRKTIYWSPKIITDENGEATVSYYNSDRSTTINIEIQGMSNTGLFGSSSISYEVVSSQSQ